MKREKKLMKSKRQKKKRIENIRKTLRKDNDILDKKSLHVSIAKSHLIPPSHRTCCKLCLVHFS